MWRRFPSVLAIAAGLVSVQFLAAQTPSSLRTADMADSWLVLYNLDPASESPAWKDWYIAQWGIAEENTLGLQLPTQERITRDQFHSLIFYPVRDHLNANPSLKSRIMGILVGYGVPGNFFLDDTHPPLAGGGGWSVSSNLADMVYSTWYKRGNPHVFLAHSQPMPPRLSKSTLTTDCYITARLDGPNLEAVKAITQRSRAISTAPSPLSTEESLYYDYLDIGAPGGDEWPALRATVQSPYCNTPQWRFPWLAYESENGPIPQCAAHFSYYRITGWDAVPWLAESPGSRIVALAMNSWGATTVRSTTGHGGRFVANALFNGGFAGAVGATAEPYTGSEPVPSTIVCCLAEGRTLGEAVFHANPYRNYMWELVGDPLLRVPHWFIDPTVAIPVPTDLGPPELTSGEETINPTPTITFVLSSRAPGVSVMYQVQIDQHPDFSSPEVDFTSGPRMSGAAAFTVGQSAETGLYAAGAEGLCLPLGDFYWRVRAVDHDGESEWACAATSHPAFHVVEPLRLVSAVSRKTHGPAGDFDIPIATDPTATTFTVECRSPGPIRIIATFNRPISSPDGVVDLGDIAVNRGTLSEVSASGSELALTINDVPDYSCLSVAFNGLSDTAGNAIAPCPGISILHHRGDVSADQVCNLSDVAYTKMIVNQLLTAENARYDVNLDGTINLIDVAYVKAAIAAVQSVCQ